MGTKSSSRAQELPGLRIENVRIAADFVHRPCADRPADTHDGMVKHKKATHRRAPRLVARVVDFLDFHRRDVPILGQPRRHGSERAPIVRADRFHLDGWGRDDQIGRADLPGGVVHEHPGGREVGGIAPRRTGVHPSLDPGDLLVAQRDVILESLNADLFLDEPRWHRPSAVAERRALP